MAQPSPAPFSTYDAIGNREDLSNFIYMISPTDTPFMAGIARTTVKPTASKGAEQHLTRS